MKRKIVKNKRSPVAVICSALGTALLMILILICVPFTLPKLLDYQAYTVISGSMEPAISTGSLVYVKNILPQEAEAGDVIAYYGGRDSNAIITHRVVENRVVMGQFITKGDANQTEDMNPVEYDNFIGRVEVIIPEIGVLAQILTSMEGKIVTGGVIGLAIVLHLLASALDRFGKNIKV